MSQVLELDLRFEMSNLIVAVPGIEEGHVIPRLHFDCRFVVLIFVLSRDYQAPKRVLASLGLAQPAARAWRPQSHRRDVEQNSLRHGYGTNPRTGMATNA
jgi:hypothetical protein